MLQINTVTVIGANGTMGRNISAIFASFGAAKVYMVSRTVEKSKAAIETASKSVRAGSIARRMVPKDYSSLAACVLESDLVFEACAERWDVKSSVHSQVAHALAGSLSDGPVAICSGTSGLSITNLAALYPEQYRSRVFGMHFFNPPYQMSLCELIRSRYANEALLEELSAYASERLLRTTVLVDDSPAFLANRIGFQFINDALHLAEEHKDSGGVDYIDAIFGPFSGRAMAPIVTADFVGLDVHKAIVDNVHANTSDFANASFELPTFVQELIDEGHLGRKAGGGLYRTKIAADGNKTREVWDVAHRTYRKVNRYVFPFAMEMCDLLYEGDYREAFDLLEVNRSSEAQICLAGLLKYAIYSYAIAGEISDGISSADDVMATGFNWCPPSAIVDALGGGERFVALCKERLGGDWCSAIDLGSIAAGHVPSAYDFRRYVKARR